MTNANAFGILGTVLGLTAFIPGINAASAAVAGGVALVYSYISTQDASTLSAALNDDFYDYVQCSLYCILNDDGQITQANVNEWAEFVRTHNVLDAARQSTADFIKGMPLDIWVGLAITGASFPNDDCIPCGGSERCCRDWRRAGEGIESYLGWNNLAVTTPALGVKFGHPDYGVFGILEPTDTSGYAWIIRESPLPPPYQIKFEPYFASEKVYESDIPSLPGGAVALPRNAEGHYTITKPYVLLSWTVNAPATPFDPGNNPKYHKFCYRPAPQEWEQVFDFTASQGSWQAITISPYGTYADYITSLGWRAKYFGPPSFQTQNQLYISKTFASRSITYIAVTVDRQAYTGNVTNAYNILNGTTSLASNANGLLSGTNTYTWTGNQLMSEIRFFCGQTTVQNSSQIEVYVKRIVIRGSGDNPF
jgi:hypothetical protein